MMDETLVFHLLPEGGSEGLPELARPEGRVPPREVWWGCLHLIYSKKFINVYE